MTDTLQISIRINVQDSSWRNSGSSELSFSATEGVTLPQLEQKVIESLLKVAEAEFEAKKAQNEKEERERVEAENKASE